VLLDRVLREVDNLPEDLRAAIEKVGLITSGGVQVPPCLVGLMAGCCTRAARAQRNAPKKFLLRARGPLKTFWAVADGLAGPLWPAICVAK
jgi:hypothetical protein